MPQNDDRYIVAIELSGTAVRGAAARIAPGAATPQVIAIETADKVSCVQYGRVQNVIDAAKHTSFVLQKLENNQALHHGKITSVYVALAGRTLSSVKTNAEISLPAEVEITDDLVRRLYQEATKIIDPARTVLKILPRKFIVDNRPVANPIGTLGSKLKGEFTVVVCSPENHRNLEMVMNDRLNPPMHVDGYIVTPLAVAKMSLTEEEKQLGCVLVDFGAHTTTISIYKDRALQYVVTLPLGSYNITHDLIAGLNLTEERAEEAKRTMGSAINEPQASSDTNRVNCYVQARLGEIVANVVAQIGFAGYKTSDLPGGIIIAGRGAKLKNFSKFVEQQSKMKIRSASVPATLSIAPSVADAADFVPLLAIINMAAGNKNAHSCVEMPEVDEPVEDNPENIDESDPETDDADFTDDYGEEYVDDTYENDDNWLLDDDEAERRSAERKHRLIERRRKLKEKDQRRREKREGSLRQKEREINGDAPLDILDDDPTETTKQKDPSLLEKIKNKLSNIFTNPNYDDNDADLDAEQ